MQVYHLIHPTHFDNLRPSCIAIGNFDGVHRGHQQVIGSALREARQAGLASGVMTFHPHPKEVLGQVEVSTYLTPLPDKLAALEQMGIDYAFIVRFTPQFSQLSAEQFINEYLIKLNMKHVVTGFDFRFGKQGQGNMHTLAQWSEEQGDFQFHYVEQIKMKDEKISSTRIRSLLASGNIEEVSQLLGRPYRITGKVVPGEQRGRTIGFPTANLALNHPYVLPRVGVYAVYVSVGRKSWPGVVNIGHKPTFHPSGQELSIEAHLFNFNEELYGETITIQFIRYLREETKFPSLEALREQIGRDVERAKTVLNCSTNA